MIAYQTVPLFEFHEYSHERSSEFGKLKENIAMVLDAQALENLEIFEVQGRTSRITEGSLFHYIERWSTKFGKRLLKKWTCSPLFNEKKLQARLDAVEELVEKNELIDTFKVKMKRIADLERYLWRIYKYSIATKSNAIYVDANSLSRLDELNILLTQFKTIIDILEEVFTDRDKINSKRLKALITFESSDIIQGFGAKKNRKKETKKQKGKQKPKKKLEEEKKYNDLNIESDEEAKISKEYKERIQNRNDDDGILPDIREHLRQFDNVITWKQIGKKKIPEPVKGLSEEFDAANNNVESTKQSIQACLTKAKKALEYPELRFSTGSKRYRFEFDIPNGKDIEVPEDFVLTTKSNKYKRYQNKELIELVEQLEDAEDALKNAISPFLSKLFRKFYKKQYLWSEFISCIAEIDCLMSLATVSKEDNMVKPVILSKDLLGKSWIEIKDVRHPWVSKWVKDFVPNDVNLGGDKPLVNLITGPNINFYQFPLYIFS